MAAQVAPSLVKVFLGFFAASAVAASGSGGVLVGVLGCVGVRPRASIRVINFFKSSAKVGIIESFYRPIERWQYELKTHS
jgi:hypothetical protein